MMANKFYPLKAWLAAIFITSFVFACWPSILTYPDATGPESLEYRTGMFFAILISELIYSAIIFICIDLLFYLLTEEFFLSPVIVKSALFACFLIGEYISSKFQHQWTWFHPFFLVYAGAAALTFYLFDVYDIKWEY
ncbi:MAG TPA: hypothetical protein VK772_07695 [Puia sp.]|jgi:hypothetical protein|nr:hypothetical protein [Puia sp.]